jgi:hypothetical protein
MGDVTDNFVCAPVLLIGFNRPDFIAQQIEVLKKIRPPKVFVAVDGPRDNVEGESCLCIRVRDCVKLIDWECDIKTLFRKENRGCKYGVSEAITWFFENEEYGIILEDDCRPDPSFLRFASEMLECYKYEERVGAISGFNTYGYQTDQTVSYRFSAHWGVWGWASWRRVWKLYDADLSYWTDSCNMIIDEAPLSKRNRDILKQSLEWVRNGGNTWDYQLQYLLLSKKMLTIYPQKRVIMNIGVGGGNGTHTAGYNYDAERWQSLEKIDFPLSHPSFIKQDIQADLLSDARYYGLLPRAFTYIGCKFPFMIKLIDFLGSRLERICPRLFRV